MTAKNDADIRGRLIENEPMSRHCSWRTGGHADLYFEPVDKEDLIGFLKTLQDDEPITWLGLGSNLLVRDGGIRGVVIAVLNNLNELKLLDDGRIYAQCGVTSARLARFCEQHGLADAAFLSGIPGTVGGALAMNAGAFGFDTWTYVESVEIINRQGELKQKSGDQFDVSYRSVKLGNYEWFTGGYFRFPERSNTNPAKIKALLEKRNASQPIGQYSCGSVFKNPENDFSARLIEACNLKGLWVGGACVSDKHANFIINARQATAADIETLIETIQKRVKEMFDTVLELEVRIIGEKA